MKTKYEGTKTLENLKKAFAGESEASFCTRPGACRTAAGTRD